MVGNWEESNNPNPVVNKEIVEVMKDIDETSGNLLSPTRLDLDPDRREAELWVDEQVIFEAMLLFLTGRANTAEFQLRLIHDCIPKDVKVLRTTQAWDRRAIGFLLSHPSFAPVPDGCPAPDITYSSLVWEFVPRTT